MTTLHPPAAVVNAVSSLRDAFADIHVLHECDEACPESCQLTDHSASALRDHDEINFDVREIIHERAEALVAVLEEWLGAGALAVRADETGSVLNNR